MSTDKLDELIRIMVGYNTESHYDFENKKFKKKNKQAIEAYIAERETALTKDLMNKAISFTANNDAGYFINSGLADVFDKKLDELELKSNESYKSWTTTTHTAQTPPNVTTVNLDEKLPHNTITRSNDENN